MKKTLGLVFLGSILVFSSLLSACGGGETSVATTQHTTAATTQHTTAATTQQTSATTTQQQQTTSASSPYSDIPIYPGFSHVIGDFEEIMASMSGTFGGVDVEWHYYEKEQVNVDDVIAYYNDNMSDNGWTHVMEMEIPNMDGVYAMYMKGTQTATIMIFRDPDYMDTYILAICKTST
jgi:hypothetical protein